MKTRRTILPQHKAEKSNKNPTSPSAFFSDRNVALTSVASARLPVVAIDMALPRMPSEKTSDATSHIPGPAPSEKNVTYNASARIANGPSSSPSQWPTKVSILRSPRSTALIKVSCLVSGGQRAYQPPLSL